MATYCFKFMKTSTLDVEQIDIVCDTLLELNVTVTTKHQGRFVAK